MRNRPHLSSAAAGLGRPGRQEHGVYLGVEEREDPGHGHGTLGQGESVHQSASSAVKPRRLPPSGKASGRCRLSGTENQREAPHTNQISIKKSFTEFESVSFSSYFHCACTRFHINPITDVSSVLQIFDICWDPFQQSRLVSCGVKHIKVTQKSSFCARLQKCGSKM